MWERRTAAMLGVLLVHAVFAWAFMVSAVPAPFVLMPPVASVPLELIDVDAWALRESSEPEEQPAADPEPSPRVRAARPASAEPAATADPAQPDTSAPGFIDWPRETRLSAARVLERERESERIAKMFAGPQGTWKSLTRRERSQFDHFRWAPGVDGLSRDENGNTIYQLPNGCALVNFVFFGCPIGAKPPAYGDLFKDMRLYFDEQRLPRTDEGNGTEPESRRPPKWSKPLPERPLPAE